MRWGVGEEQTFVRRRFTTGGFLDGEPLPATYADLTFPATRDPVPDDEIATLPEGERQSGQMWILTETPLRTANERTTPMTLADHVLIDGEWFEVRSSVYFPRIIPHYEARVMKVYP